ncbi:MAG TPA: GNAT family N-acetyltransferase [Vicinamibacterales bacterium]
MTVTDWRDAPSDVVQPLLLAERTRVLDALHWDLAPALRLVEHARQRGDVPGLILRDRAGQPAGWAFYILANRTLQLGGLHARTAAGLRLLLDRVLASPEAELAQGVSCFLPAASQSLVSALERLRFEVRVHECLEASLVSWPPAAADTVPLRQLGDVDAPAIVRLLARAYAGERAARTFAPAGRIEEWAHYVGQILTGPSLGAWRPSQSFGIDGRDGSLKAAVLTTEIARQVAHVAQIAVDPEARRGGLARRLLHAAGAAAAAAGMRRVTLLVDEENAAARQLYAAFGFRPIGRWIHATRGPVPRRIGGVVVRATSRTRAA